jgi:hypothetical protein
MRLYLGLIACHMFVVGFNAHANGLPICILELQGGSAVSGSFVCSGGTISAAFHHSIPDGSFRAIGISLAPSSCQRPGCLLTICGNSRAIIHATVKNMSVPGEKSPSILCLGGQSHILLKGPFFNGNKAAGVNAAGNSTLHIEDGLFTNGVTIAGAGFIARGNSRVEVSRSKFINNTVAGW